MSKISFFHFEADDPKRAAKFYRSVFGWKFKREDHGEESYWDVDTGGRGIEGGMGLKTGNQHVVNTIEVDDIDRSLKKIQKSGGEIYMDKMTIQGEGYLAFFKDTEGNIFGVMENDRRAR